MGVGKNECVAATPSESEGGSGVSSHFAPKYHGSLDEAKASAFLRARKQRERQQEQTVSKRYRRLVAIRSRAS